MSSSPKRRSKNSSPLSPRSLPAKLQKQRARRSRAKKVENTVPAQTILDLEQTRVDLIGTINRLVNVTEHSAIEESENVARVLKEIQDNLDAYTFTLEP